MSSDKVVHSISSNCTKFVPDDLTPNLQKYCREIQHIPIISGENTTLSIELPGISNLLNFFITARKRSLRRLCFYTCLSVILFTGGEGSPGPHAERLLRGLAGGRVSRSTPRGHVEGSGRGSPGPGGVSQHALRQTPPPPGSRRLLLRAVRIILECILVLPFPNLSGCNGTFLSASLCAEYSPSCFICSAEYVKGFFFPPPHVPITSIWNLTLSYC